MQEIVSKNKCCGCYACFNLCPKNAISMEEDELGFKYPVIDQKKCINCGMCKNICPSVNKKTEIKKKINAFAAYNINLDERLSSSSGGMFILIAKEIIKREGIVFGASFDKDFNVRHAYVENEKELEQFLGSKYVQSSIGNTYRKVKEFLDKDRYVLFSGTPCQIEGLKSYLKKDYKKLYTQDIICHGVPAPQVWRKYLEYQRNNNKEKIRNVSFRNKDHGWALYRTKILFDTRTYSESFNDDIYMRLFLKNLCLRESCYNCDFKKKYRISDITLADYWGISNVHNNMNDDKGTSLIIVNTEKGNELFQLIEDNIIYVETDLDVAIKYNSAMIKSANKNDSRNELITDFNRMDICELANKYAPRPKLYKRIINKIKRIIKKIFKR